MLRKVKLYGELADFVGHKELDAVINSTADAIRFLVSNFPKLEAHMTNRHYKVLVDDYDIDETELHNPIGQSDISIVPVISGAGGNFGKILLGAVLIGFAIVNPSVGFGLGPGGLGAGFSTASGAFSLTAFAGNIGIALVLTGVSEMLTPLPKRPEFSSEEDPRLSFSFGGTQQTGRAGTPVPLVYGEIFTGSVVISGGIDTEQVQA